MVYNLRSIGMSLMQNSGQEGYLLKPEKGEHQRLAGSSDTASASSLNNPVGKQSSTSANQNAYLECNTNQNHASDTYVSLMSSFEESRVKSKHKRRKQANTLRTMELQNTSVINLDSSWDSDVNLDLTTPLSYTSDGEVYNISNNSTPNKSSSSVDSVATLTDKNFVCSVLNCGAKFSTEMRLEDHMQLFKHSPSNPCLLAENCSVSNIPICYMCPDCDLEFQSCDECTEHINRSKHLRFYPPLAIKAYMCSQCLYLFPSIDACWRHMENTSHHGMYYPFANDYSTEEKHSGPVAVAEELVQDLISKCSKVAYTVQCLECGMLIETPAILNHHIRETQNQHIVASLTETSLVDVFASYLASYSCNVCHRLFSGELKELAKHQCAKRVMGTITENDTQSFAQFIKRCALSVIKSLEPENMPGPSRVPRPSPAHDKKAKRLEYDCGAAAEVSENLYSQMKEQPDNRSLTGSDNEPVCQSRECTRRKEKKTQWESQPESVGGNNVSPPQCTNSCGNKTDKSIRKNENEQKNTKNDAEVITLSDTDDGSDEMEAKISPAAGAKRKRKKSASGNSKKGSCYDLSTQSVATPSSSQLTKVVSSHLQESPFFVMNYKPRPSTMNIDVLTQGHTSKANENNASTAYACPVLQLQPTGTSPVRYSLRNRNILETSDESQKNSTIDLTQSSDESFRNIAKTLVEEMHASIYAGSTTDLLIGDPQQNKKDRSRSPLQIPTTCTTQDGPYGISSFPANFSSHQPSSALTQGQLAAPYSDNFHGIHNVIGSNRPFGQSPYVAVNQCSTAVVQPMVHPPLLPSSHCIQTSVAGHFLNAFGGSHASGRGTGYNFRSQAAGTSHKTCSESFSSRATSVLSNANKPETSNGKPSVENLVSTTNLQRMKNIVFLDLDNWPSFFHKLPCCLPDLTFVWGFFGGKNMWMEPNRLAIFRQMKQKGLFYLNERCGTTKDAADFAIVLTVGKMDEKLPSDIAFTIMSGDKGFCEVERLMSDSERKVMVVNPHTAAQFSNDMIYALVTSVTDT